MTGPYQFTPSFRLHQQCLGFLEMYRNIAQLL